MVGLCSDPRPGKGAAPLPPANGLRDLGAAPQMRRRPERRRAGKQPDLRQPRRIPAAAGGRRGPEATGPAGAATGEGKARGRWGSARPGQRLGVLAARPPRVPLTGRSGWRTGSRRRGPTWWRRRRRREPEGARRCLAGPALNELARAVPWRGRGEAEPLRRRGGACAPAASRTQPPAKPRPSHPPSSRPRAGAGSPGVRFWRRRGRGGAPLPEGSAAVGRSRRGTGRPRGSAWPRVARVCMRPSPCPRPAVREAATGILAFSDQP